MDRLVGKLIAEVEALRFCENTPVIFMRVNGTRKGQNPQSTIGGNNLSCLNGSMLKGGCFVPTIANLPSKTPVGLELCGQVTGDKLQIQQFRSVKRVLDRGQDGLASKVSCPSRHFSGTKIGNLPQANVAGSLGVNNHRLNREQCVR